MATRVGRGARASIALLVGATVASLFAISGSTAAAGEPEPVWRQYPFVCTTAREGLGQPQVDNATQGIPVALEDVNGNYPKDGNGYPTEAATIVGYSKDCNADTVYEYRYRTDSASCQEMANWRNAGCFKPLGTTIPDTLPDDIDHITTSDMEPGETIPYIVRIEKGVINRFIFAIAMLAPETETDPSDPDTSAWNGKLVFHFGGGVAGGFYQGRIGTSDLLYHQAITLGHAVMYSSGTSSSTHYNLKVGGETAAMVKEHFEQAYGDPIYTIGVGGSGGGVQQYVYAQNHPDLLDGGVPQYSYADMATQTIHIGDCELLEHYFDKTDNTNTRWQTIENRILVEGLNAESAPIDPAAQWGALLGAGFPKLGLPIPDDGPGSTVPLTECRAAWTGLTPALMNPKFSVTSSLDELVGYDLDEVEFTHWGDSQNVYGLDEEGWGRVPWSNEGVQYGLHAVWNGRITPKEFLRLNALVGSWQHTSDQVHEGAPYECHPELAVYARGCSEAELFALLGGPDEVLREKFDLWSSRNMRLSPDGVEPAPRTAADPIAIANAHANGHVFTGDIDIPMIDWRHYLEEHLDMHNSNQSFATRQRLIEGRGDYDNQLVWFTDGNPEPGFDQTPMAFEVLDEWILNMQAHPELSVGEAKPEGATDACFATDGTLLHEGDDVWDGILDDGPKGPCAKEFKTYTTSRIEAGAPVTGDVFECTDTVTGPGQVGVQSVEDAIAEGVYGGWTPNAAQQARLEEIFPDGVCDYGADGYFHFDQARAGAPTDVATTPRNGAIGVTWSAPTFTGGSPITGYIAEAVPVDGGATVPYCTSDGRRACTITDVPNGVRHKVRVRAVTSVGQGRTSNPAVVEVARTVPDAPPAPNATAGDRSATIRWQRPADDGGARITAYRVVSKPGERSCQTDGERSCTVNGLANGTPHTFRVQARNEAGWGPLSGPSPRVTPTRAAG